MFTPATYFQGLALAMYIMACLVISAVRWFHMCRPFDRNPRYFYPGRKATSILYFSAITLLPYFCAPESTGAWLLVKAYFLPVTLYFLTILLFSYFGSVMHWRRWRRPTLALGAVALFALIAGPLACLLMGENVNGEWLGNIIILVLGVVMTATCFFAVRIVLRWAARYDVEEYSNPEDFPVNFARKMGRIVFLAAILMWTAFLSNNRNVMAAVQLLLVGASVQMLISALHPHRKGTPALKEGKEDEKKQVYSYKLSPIKAKAIANAIRREVEQKQAFLDPHLTLRDVSLRCGYNRTYVAGIFKSEFGGFFHYVNTLRLQHAEAYRAANPKASITEIAESSGFGSRQSYYSVVAAISSKTRP